jgi:hypothetical protein
MRRSGAPWLLDNGAERRAGATSGAWRVPRPPRSRGVVGQCPRSPVECPRHSSELLREQVVTCQRESRVRRARAACATDPKIRPTSTRTAPSRTSVSGSVQEPAIIEALGSEGRCGAPDARYRHAMPVLWPIESCRRARSSGVGCAKITHMKKTVAARRASTSQRLSRSTPAIARLSGLIADPLRWRRTRSTCLVRGLGRRAGRSGRSASSSPPKSHATTAGPIGIGNHDVAPVMPSTRYPAAAPSSGLTMKARCTMSMTPNGASRVPVGARETSRGLARGEAWCARGNYRGVAMASPSSGTART